MSDVTPQTWIERPLSQLCAKIPHRMKGPAGDPVVRSAAVDSRRVVPGAIFAALPGQKADGRDFLLDAILRGAVAVVGPAPAPAGCPVPFVETDDPRAALGVIASELAGRPHERLVLCGITGTSGKTTTSMLLDAVLGLGHPRRGLFGTISYRGRGGDDAATPAHHTTPEAVDLCPMLAALADDGGTAATMEVSSHALALGRVAGLRFDLAVFTNLSRDHLDFHRDFEDYFAAKAKLFQLLKPGGKAVVNADDVYGRRLLESLPPRTVAGFTLEGRARCELSVVAKATSAGLLLHCRQASTGATFEVRSPLIGRPNAENLAAAVLAGLALGFAPADIAAALQAVLVVPGRLERVPNRRGCTVLVDYAHKPAALEGVLKAVRPIATADGGRVRVVFGCGGDRDRGKRPLMGAVAAEFADDVIVTSDNPRSEDPALIAQEIVAGIPRAGGAAAGAASRVEILLDRRAAIGAALSRAREGDVVVIAGKGHETYQSAGASVLPFDDRLVAREFLAADPPTAGDATTVAAT